VISRDDFAVRASSLVRPDHGNDAFSPLDAQYHLATKASEHRRVIAVLPTGSGKTLGAALPFAMGLLDPGQMCFMTPLRTLTSAQATILSDTIRPAIASTNLGLPWDVRQQTGMSPDDPDFLSTVNVATFDQAISSALRISYSASMRRRTVNAGAVLSSYLVADELHLFPRGEALTTLLCLLKHRPPELPFLLMTATLTPAVAQGLANLLHAELIDESLSQADRQRLHLEQRTRRVRWQPEPFSVRQIIDALHETAGRRVLVVANTVKRAIELGQALEPLVSRERLRVLHARFYQTDRREHERAILTAFGKWQPDLKTEAFGRDGGVVVATQVVEVGLDISADVIFTELAPASALVQRWGRCARWGGTGFVIVAQPDGGDRPVYPYVSREDSVPVEKTRAWLETHASGGEGVIMDDATERALLNAGHREADERWLSTLTSELTRRTTKMGDTIAQGRYEMAGELVRHVDTRTVLICGGDLNTRLREPLSMQGFSLAPGSLMPLVERKPPEAVDADQHNEDEGEGMISFDLSPDIPWKLKRPVWPEKDADSERDASVVSGWVDVLTSVELKRTPLMVVNPAVVSYDPFFGLSLIASARAVEEHYWAQPAERSSRQAQNWTSRQRETLEAHIANMLHLYDGHPALGPRLRRVAVVIEMWCGWPAGTLDRLVRAAIVAHDAGKLSPAWQRGITAYQHAIGKPVESWLVHTDEAGDIRAPFPRPPHALSGAAHSQALGIALDSAVDDAALASDVGARPSNVLFSAIATHHTPSLSTYLLSRDEFLDDAAIAELNRLLRISNLPEEAATLTLENYVGCGVEQHDLDAESTEREAFVLALVTRMLRLADGWSQQFFR
jgi:CRISPR-associated endonuclease/helicase Cas3